MNHVLPLLGASLHIWRMADGRELLASEFEGLYGRYRLGSPDGLVHYTCARVTHRFVGGRAAGKAAVGRTDRDLVISYAIGYQAILTVWQAGYVSCHFKQIPVSKSPSVSSWTRRKDKRVRSSVCHVITRPVV